MLNNFLLEWLRPPKFDDDSVKTREARTLHVYLYIHTAILLATIPIPLFVSNRPNIAIIILAILIVFNASLLYIARQGKVRAATIGFLGVAWLNSAAFVTITGIEIEAAAMFFPVIAMATLFLGIRAGIVATAAALIHIIVLVFMDAQTLASLQIFTIDMQTNLVVFILTSMILLVPLGLKHIELTEALKQQQAQLEAMAEIEIGLRESEERFRLISSVTSDYTFSSYLDEDGTLDHVLLTGNFTEITGYKADEFVKLGGWRATIHPDDLEQDAADFARLSNNESVVSEIRIVHKSGTVKWVRVDTDPIWDHEKNKLIGINGGVRDITERKHAALVQETLFEISQARIEVDSLPDLLKFTHEKLKLLMQADNFYVALYDPETDFYSFPYGVDAEEDDWSPSTLENSLTDYVRRKGDAVIITAETHDRLSEELGVDLVGAWSEVWIGAPLKTSGNVFGVIALQDYEKADAYTVDDLQLLTYISENIAWVIESKRLEGELQTYTQNLEMLVSERTSALRRANHQMELILNNTSDALALTNKDGDIVLANPAYIQLFGEDVKSSIELILHQLDDEDHVITTSQALIKALYDKQQQRFEIQVLPTENATKDIDVALLPIVENDSEQVGMLLSGRDITHVKDIERFKSRFVADAVHDLATPISGLSTRLYMLKRNPERLSYHVGSLENQVNHLRNLLTDLKTLSRLDQQAVELNLADVEINQVVQRVFDTYETVAIEKEQTITLTLSSEVTTLSLDERQIERVLVNLVSNAINYTPAQKAIHIETKENGNWVKISVQDEGMGIAEENISKVFDRFYRTDEARDNLASGTGLGLAIAKTLVELHGGTIDVSSTVNIGSTFIVQLPIASIGQPPN